MRTLIGALIAVLLLVGGVARAQAPSIEAFAAPSRAYSGTLSPSGHYFAFVERTDEHEQVVVFDLDAGTRNVVQRATMGQSRIYWVEWKGDDRLLSSVGLIQRVDAVGRTGSRLGGSGQDEYWMQRVIATDRDGGNPVQMFEGQLRHLLHNWGATVVIDEIPNDPDHVMLIATDNFGVGAWRGDVRSGRAEKIADGSWETTNYFTDITGYPVVREDIIPDGSGFRYFRRAPGERNWTFFREARRAELATNSPDFEIYGRGPSPGEVYVTARDDGRDKRALYLLNTATGQIGAPLYEGANADAIGPVVDRSTRQLLLGCEFASRLSCRAQDQTLQRHLAAVNGFFDNAATVYLLQMSQDRGRWLLWVEGPVEAGGYYLYNRDARSVVLLVPAHPELASIPLASVDVVNYQSRDGAPLWAYVTRPIGAQGALPMVVLPHGGPEARDYFGFDSFAQFLASRGYLVVQPHFRGSLGTGRAFADAGRRQWGRLMQNDLTDAVQHMITTGVADPERVCIVGASYGGYAALAGVTFNPDLYRCAVSIAGVSDLPDFMRIERREGGASVNYQYWLRSVGDPNADSAALVAASPARHAAAIRAPVLLIHGETDETVLIGQSETMQRALNSAGRPTRLVRLRDSDHYWANWTTANRLTLYRETEAFLAQNLGP